MRLSSGGNQACEVRHDVNSKHGLESPSVCGIEEGESDPEASG